MEKDVKQNFTEKRKKLLEDFKQGNDKAINEVSDIVLKAATKYGLIFGKAFQMPVEDLTSEAYIIGFEFLQQYNTDSLTNISFIISHLERKIHIQLRKIVSEYYDIPKKDAEAYLNIYLSIYHSKVEGNYLLNFTREQLSTFQRILEIVSTKFVHLQVNIPGLVIDEEEQFELTDLRLFRPILMKVLETLTPIEQKTLCLRFGFNGDCMSYRDAGLLMNLTAPRIQQIEAKALRKLRHPVRSRLLVY